jgi:Orsellinic acid/F9775 biosynthesis cluster protein D
MAEQQQTHPIVVPMELSQLIAVNVEYRVLVCLRNQCRKAVNPVGLVEHLRKIHHEEPRVRKQMQEFVTGIPWRYNYAAVLLPANGLAPQPNIPAA